MFSEEKTKKRKTSLKLWEKKYDFLKTYADIREVRGFGPNFGIKEGVTNK